MVPELLPELEPPLELLLLELDEPPPSSVVTGLSVPESSVVVPDELDDEQPVPAAKARPRPSEATKRIFEFCIGKALSWKKLAFTPAIAKRRGVYL